MIAKQFRKKPAQEHIWNNPIKILQNLNVTNVCLYICGFNSSVCDFNSYICIFVILRLVEGRDASTPIADPKNLATAYG